MLKKLNYENMKFKTKYKWSSLESPPLNIYIFQQQNQTLINKNLHGDRSKKLGETINN